MHRQPLLTELSFAANSSVACCRDEWSASVRRSRAALVSRDIPSSCSRVWARRSSRVDDCLTGFDPVMSKFLCYRGGSWSPEGGELQMIAACARSSHLSSPLALNVVCRANSTKCTVLCYSITLSHSECAVATKDDDKRDRLPQLQVASSAHHF